ncbi:3,4-dihydroxy-2-butanone 4-phosphate synthase [Westerdykella ornata]|uniref:3,4-dihydroxy-2-butanone 4-phosphate synthase n=1 Tax=Westerdykella ornata TaxID=318751 RepID=A0A6A6J5B3_WESOR|nr:3,4-dihydroxy-2-butanone 4-phosphate synthase [Westerdykella ornata]KAF2271582.1 3,4-dihydroxy-2-butanone 4-phosphate synthase [Westerdykella ornata]
MSTSQRVSDTWLAGKNIDPELLKPLDAAFDSIPDVIDAFANDEFVIVLDSPDRENEGDLIIAASALTTEKAAFMIRYTSGYICVPMPTQRCAELGLEPMVTKNQDPHRTAYAITVDANHPDITTGISAHDRALTCRQLANPQSKPSDLRRPGHIVPLHARPGGVRERKGHTEAAVDLCLLARKQPVGAICEIVRDGEPVKGKPEFRNSGMMRRDECLAFGKEFGIKVCTIEDLYRFWQAVDGASNITA